MEKGDQQKKDLTSFKGSVGISSDPNSQLYRPLDQSKKQIRVLSLVSNDRVDDAICCTLSTISLEDDLNFIPLSYVWGDATKTTEIFVNGISFQATLNLVDFFRHHKFLPAEHLKTRLWVDAICINQADLEERSQQVASMTEIYTGPPLTVSWLGPKSIEEESDLAMEWIQIISDQFVESDEQDSTEWVENNARKLLKGEGPGPVWSSISHIFDRKYWSRVWTLQECVLPQQNLILCGSRYLYFSALENLHKALADLVSRENGNPLISKDRSYPDDEAHLRQELSFKHFMYTTIGIIKIERIRRLKEMVLEQKENIAISALIKSEPDYAIIRSWSITYIMRGLDVTDPRDYIYGAMGLCNHPYLPIDYTQTKAALFCQHAAFIILAASRYPSSGILCAMLQIAGFGIADDVVPSWVPVWGKMLPSTSRPDYNASGLNGSESDISTQLFVDGKILHTTGVLYSKIQYIQPRKAQNLSEFVAGIFSAFIQNEKVSPIRIFELLLHVFAIEPWHGTLFPDDEIPQLACSFLLQLINEEATSTEVDDSLSSKRVESNDDHSSQVLDRLLQKFKLHSNTSPAHHFWDPIFPNGLNLPLSTKQYSEFMSYAQPMLKALQNKDKIALSYNETYFCTESGNIGSVGGLIAEGDVLCIITACDRPVVLREVNHGAYVYVGMTFVPDLMDGEGMADVERNDEKGGEKRLTKKRTADTMLEAENAAHKTRRRIQKFLIH